MIKFDKNKSKLTDLQNDIYNLSLRKKRRKK